MRIIHEIEGIPQVVVGGSTYAKRLDQEKAPSWKAEVSVHCVLAVTNEKVVMEFEGPYASIHKMLKDALAAVEAAQKDFIERGLIEP